MSFKRVLRVLNEAEQAGDAARLWRLHKRCTYHAHRSAPGKRLAWSTIGMAAGDRARGIEARAAGDFKLAAAYASSSVALLSWLLKYYRPKGKRIRRRR